jgi:tRNA modification GTPase
MDRSGLTIASPITPKGIGAVAGIRISGPDALSILLNVTTATTDKLLPGRLILTTFLENGLPLDEVTVCYRQAPNSFTGDDTVEIFCHGGWVMPSLLMDQLLEKGAAYAQPGEFSKRALENGRMDLIKIEGIQQIVQARTKQEAILAGSNLFGQFQKQLHDLVEDMIMIKTYFEAQISFPLDMEEATFPIIQRLDSVVSRIRHLLHVAKQSDQLKKGYEVLIIGKTNVGKSSLFNALLGWDRMLVSPYPSTTHDYVMELIDLHGYPVYLIDSAGYIKNGNGLDALFNQTLPGKVQQAFLSLFVLDASCYHPEDLDLIRQFPDSRKLIVVNKADLNEAFPVSDINTAFPGLPVCIVSSVTKDGLYELMEEVYNQIKITNPEEQDFYMNERHQYAIKQCGIMMEKIVQQYRNGSFMDMIASDIDLASQWLEELLGYRMQDAAYQRIFESFCIGK